MLTLNHPGRSRVDFVAAPPAPELKTIRVALAGCGVVGGSFVSLLERSGEALARQYGIRIEIATVLVRNTNRNRGLNIASDIFTDSCESFLSVPVDVVIEAIGGQHPAGLIAATALSRGNRFITANKELVSQEGAHLELLARANAARFDFDAAVGGGAPVLRTLRDSIAAERPASLRGILNGTSNFVLTELENGQSFDTAIARARQRGLAEEDYSRDLDGRDAAAKIAILSWRAFGINPSAVAVRRTSLLPDPARFVAHAERLGARVRLVAECAVVGESRLSASVFPAIVSADSALGRTVREENRIELDLGWSAPLSVTAPGAGGIPTATALLSDLLTAAPVEGHAVNGARSFISVADPRPHRWLVASRSFGESARALFAAGEILSVGLDPETGDTVILTSELTCDAIDLIVENLRLLGANPIAARLDLPILSGVIQ